MRWKSWVGTLLLLAGAVVGCKQQCFLTESDYNHFRSQLPTNLENQPQIAAKPVTQVTGPPPTVLNPEREIRYLSLAEAICIGLEQGTVGQQQLNILFLVQPNQNQVAFEQPVQFTGRGLANASDSIRALALDPATVGAGIEAALSKF